MLSDNIHSIYNNSEVALIQSLSVPTKVVCINSWYVLNERPNYNEMRRVRPTIHVLCNGPVILSSGLNSRAFLS